MNNHYGVDATRVTGVKYNIDIININMRNIISMVVFFPDADAR